MGRLIVLALLLLAGVQAKDEPELDRLLRVAREASPVVRPQAAKRFVALGAPAAERARAEAAGKPGGLAVLGVDLLEVLGEIDDAALRADLWSSLSDRDFAFRASVARTLGRTARKGEEERFLANLADPLATVRTASVLGLETLGDCAHAQRVHALLGDSDDRTRREAAVLLDRCGDPLPLWHLVEELKREDRFFEQETGKAARFEALRLLEARFGERYGFAPENPPSTVENQAAIARFGERVSALAGERTYELPEAARAAGPTAGETLGLELRSCRRGDFFLRWTADDALLVGTGHAQRIALPAGATAGLAARAQELLAPLGAADFFGEPGCDLEAFTVPAASGAARVLRVSKGPAPVPGLRPEALTRWAQALLASIPQGREELRGRLAEALREVGGGV
jgi:hypothetical protein